MRIKTYNGFYARKLLNGYIFRARERGFIGNKIHLDLKLQPPENQPGPTMLGEEVDPLYTLRISFADSSINDPSGYLEYYTTSPSFRGDIIISQTSININGVSTPIQKFYRDNDVAIKLTDYPTSSISITSNDVLEVFEGTMSEIVSGVSSGSSLVVGDSIALPSDMIVMGLSGPLDSVPNTGGTGYMQFGSGIPTSPENDHLLDDKYMLHVNYSETPDYILGVVNKIYIWEFSEFRVYNQKSLEQLHLKGI